MMSQAITQQGVIRLLTDKFKAVCTDLLANEENTFGLRYKGISVHATLPNDWIISIQGGDGIYSEPRAKATYYTELEVACWPIGGEISQVSRLIDQDYMPDCDSVCGWVKVEDLETVISIVATIDDPNPTGRKVY